MLYRVLNFTINSARSLLMKEGASSVSVPFGLGHDIFCIRHLPNIANAEALGEWICGIQHHLLISCDLCASFHSRAYSIIPADAGNIRALSHEVCPDDTAVAELLSHL